MTALATLIIGTKAEADCTFEIGSSPTDPTTVVAKVRNPAGTITTYTYGVDAALTRLSSGEYRLLFTVDRQGTWEVRFAGTGDVVAAVEQSITVPASRFA